MTKQFDEGYQEGRDDGYQEGHEAGYRQAIKDVRKILKIREDAVRYNMNQLHDHSFALGSLDNIQTIHSDIKSMLRSRKVKKGMK